MKKNTIRQLFFLTLFFIFFSCTKDTLENGKPNLNIILTPETISGDTIFPFGIRYKIILHGNSPESEITYFNITQKNGKKQVLLDSGLFAKDFTHTATILKSTKTVDTICFFVMNKVRQKDSLKLIVKLQSGAVFGKIKTFSNIILGAQNSTISNHFFSIDNGLIYTLEEAYNNQSAIDIDYFYDVYNATLGSPAEADGPAIYNGTFGIANWTIKNETRYDTTKVTSNQFDAALHDSLLLAVFEPANGKRKAKDLKPGDVFSFSAHDGKIGLIKINSVNGTQRGTVNFTLKIQE